MEILNLLWGVVVIGIVDGPDVGVDQVEVHQLDDSLGRDEDDVRWNIDVSRLEINSIQAALQDAVKLAFIEILLLPTPRFDFVN